MALKWAKPVNRRSPEQRTAHLILTFSNANAANRAITDGLTICNRRCHVEKVKREPTRCLKCQGWNHFTKDCLEKEDRCSNCTENHRTSDCSTPQKRHCVSCKTDNHASWSRDCPTFVKKANDYNIRNPENALQYIPTTDPWTWTSKDKQPDSATPTSTPTTQAADIPNPKNAQPAPKKATTNTRKYDTYIPDYNRHRNTRD